MTQAQIVPEGEGEGEEREREADTAAHIIVRSCIHVSLLN
jgi:hypothetical protein